MCLRKRIVVYLILMLTLCTLAPAPSYAGDPQGETNNNRRTPPPIPDWVIYLILNRSSFLTKPGSTSLSTIGFFVGFPI
jgi:hypothetical protein